MNNVIAGESWEREAEGIVQILNDNIILVRAALISRSENCEDSHFSLIVVVVPFYSDGKRKEGWYEMYEEEKRGNVFTN